jgi:hypothetical protein
MAYLYLLMVVWVVLLNKQVRYGLTRISKGPCLRSGSVLAFLRGEEAEKTISNSLYNFRNKILYILRHWNCGPHKMECKL